MTRGKPIREDAEYKGEISELNPETGEETQKQIVFKQNDLNGYFESLRDVRQFEDNITTNSSAEQINKFG